MNSDGTVLNERGLIENRPDWVLTLRTKNVSNSLELPTRLTWNCGTQTLPLSTHYSYDRCKWRRYCPQPMGQSHNSGQRDRYNRNPHLIHIRRLLSGCLQHWWNKRPYGKFSDGVWKGEADTHPPVLPTKLLLNTIGSFLLYKSIVPNNYEKIWIYPNFCVLLQTNKKALQMKEIAARINKAIIEKDIVIEQDGSLTINYWDDEDGQ